MAGIESVIDPTIQIVLTFSLAFAMKKVGYFDQDDAFRTIKFVVNVLVPMTFLVNIPKVELHLTWLALPAAAILYTAITLPLFRLMFMRFPEGLDRSQRGQMLACCTGHAVPLVGYPVLGGFYGPEGLAMCACWDLVGVIFAYSFTFIVSFLYAPRPVEQETRSPLPAPEPKMTRSSSLEHLRAFLSKTDPAEAVEASVEHMAGTACTKRSRTHTGVSEHSVELSSFVSQPTVRQRMTEKLNSIDEAPVDGPRLQDSKSGLIILLSSVLRTMLKLTSIQGFILAVVMRITGITTEHFPAAVATTMKAAASCTPFMAIFGLGLFFQPSLFKEKEHASRLLIVVGARYGAGLIIGLILYMIVRHYDVKVATILACNLVMPTPPPVIAYAKDFGYNAAFAATVVNACLMVSFILVFAIVMILGP